MEEIIRILMRRDGYGYDEAKERVLEVREMIEKHVERGELDLAEEVLTDELGLEPDYLDLLI